MKMIVRSKAPALLLLSALAAGAFLASCSSGEESCAETATCPFARTDAASDSEPGDGSDAAVSKADGTGGRDGAGDSLIDASIDGAVSADARIDATRADVATNDAYPADSRADVTDANRNADADGASAPDLGGADAHVADSGRDDADTGPNLIDANSDATDAADAAGTPDVFSDAVDACALSTCVCNPTTCPNGCCNGNTCVTTPGMSACGRGGGACKTCNPGQHCDGTDCVCDSTSCTGCCDTAKECKTNGQNTCGTSGTACTACAATQQCSSSGQCVCNAASCPGGCCDGNTCLPYASQSDTQCGAGGVACGGCATGKSCSKSSSACVTWCGTQTIPSGVAASDYQCVDFDEGLPPANIWASVNTGPGSLALSTARATSLPNSLETSATALGFDPASLGTHTLAWTATAATPFTRATVWAALNPTAIPGMSTAWSGHGICLLTVSFPSALHESYACLTYTFSADMPWANPYTGLYVHWVYFQDDSGDQDDCQVNGSFPLNNWTNAELRVSATTGLVEVVLGGVTSTCTRMPNITPPSETAPLIQIGSKSTPTSGPWTSYVDNVRASVWR